MKNYILFCKRVFDRVLPQKCNICPSSNDAPDSLVLIEYHFVTLVISGGVQDFPNVKYVPWLNTG